MSLIAGLNFKVRSASDELSELINDAYLKRQREDKERTKESFSPSMIGGGYHGTCPRYWYLAFDGGMFREKVEPAGLAIMWDGIDAHERLQKLFEDAGLLEEAEIEVKTEDPPIRGYVDLKILFRDEPVIGEIKTTRQEAFVHRVARRKPTKGHLVQLLIYMWALGVDKGFLYYENRNTKEFVIITVAMNEANKIVLDKALDWMRTVRKAWEDKTIPQPGYQKRNKICQKCPLFDACWEGDAPKGDLKIPVFGKHDE